MGVVGASYLYWQNTNSAGQQNRLEAMDEIKQPNQSKIVTGDGNKEIETYTVKLPGAYKGYTPDDFDSDTGRRILFFHAPWCPQCRKLDASIKAAEIPDNTTIYKVDFDKSQDMRKLYGVTLQTTLVRVGVTGEVLEKYAAYDKPTYASLEANLLD